MLQSNLELRPHKCMARPSIHPRAFYCVYCGIYMTRSAQGPQFYRSPRFNIIDPYRVDPDVLFKELINYQHSSRVYNSKACHLIYRDDMIAFIEVITSKLTFKENTYHLAIALLDSFMSLYTVEKRMLKLMSFIAPYLASKLEESNRKLPELSYVVKLFDNMYTLEEVQRCEAVFLKTLHFKLNLKTPYTFIEYFFSKGILNDVDLKMMNNTERDSIVTKFETVVTFFIRIAVKKYDFFKYKPIIVATASIACARKVFNFNDIWNDDLKTLTSISWRNNHLCTNELYEFTAHICPHSLGSYQSNSFIDHLFASNQLITIKSNQSINTDYDSEKEIHTPQKLSPDDSKDVFFFNNEIPCKKYFREEKPLFVSNFGNFK